MDEDSSRSNQAQRRSKSYQLAELDRDFVLGDSMRGVRLSLSMPKTAARVSALIRTFGHAHTEVWTATEWDRFKDLVRTLPGPSAGKRSKPSRVERRHQHCRRIGAAPDG